MRGNKHAQQGKHDMLVSDARDLEQALQRPQSTEQVDTQKEGTEMETFLLYLQNVLGLGDLHGDFKCYQQKNMSKGIWRDK